MPHASTSPRDIAHHLTPDLFSFRKAVSDQLSENIFPHLPSIICSAQPMLEAAKVNSVAEFERLYRVVRRQDVFRNRNVLIVAGLNIDLMRGYTPFPGCLFVPWAAYVIKARSFPRDFFSFARISGIWKPHPVLFECWNRAKCTTV
jgi:hypothetical protein